MTPLGGVLLTAVSLAAGWLGLWPIRGRLGPRGYHLSAYPVGLLLWPLVVALESPMRVGYRPLPALALLVMALFAAASLVRRLAGDDVASEHVSAASYLAWGGAVLGVATVVALTGITSAAYDSVFHYERWGTWLTQTGALHKEILGAYGVLIPSIHAANRFLGSDWTSTPYPVLSLHVAAFFFVAVRDWTRTRVSTFASYAITVGFLGLLITAPRYIHHMLYVHSHMISAAYLFLSLYALQRAYLEGGATRVAPAQPARYAWLFVAGLASVGLALARADGIAYLAVPIAVGSLLWLESGHSRRGQALFLCTVAAPIALVYGSAFLTLGFWRAGKLGGKKAAAVLAALAVGGGLTLLVDRMPRLGAWLHRRGRALASVAILEFVAILGAIALRPAGFTLAMRNMVANLLRTGGNGHLWYFALGAIAVSLLYGGQWRSGRWPVYLLFAIGQFFAIALVVHGVGHPGRLSPADSFNRISFHAVPLIFWYAAIVVTAVVEEFSRGSERVPS